MEHSLSLSTDTAGSNSKETTLNHKRLHTEIHHHHPETEGEGRSKRGKITLELEQPNSTTDSSEMMIIRNAASEKDIHTADIVYYTSIRFGKMIFYEAPHKLLKRQKWSLKEEINSGNNYWKFCTPCIDSGQLFIQSVKGKKLPKNFSFVAGYELKLAGCARPELEEIEALALLNTGLLITLSEETEYYLSNLRFKVTKHEIQHLVFQTPNGGAPSLQDMDACVTAIQKCITEGRLAVVHCHAGEGRTGTVLAAFLCKNGKNTMATTTTAAATTTTTTLGKNVTKESCTPSNRTQYLSPQEAISTLQVYRHRSLQGWTAKDDTYTNNNIQVGQLEKYYQAFVLSTSLLNSSSSTTTTKAINKR